MDNSERQPRAGRSGPSPALVALFLVGVIVLAAVATLALVGGGKEKSDAKATSPQEQVDPFEGLAPDPLQQKTPHR